MRAVDRWIAPPVGVLIGDGAGVQLTRWSLGRADARCGRRNLWLRALDAAGLGFDS